jgi:HEAT repeats
MRRRIAVLLASGLAALSALALSTGEARAQFAPRTPEPLRLSAWQASALRTLQTDPSPRAREQALRQLGRSEDPRLIPVLAHYAAYDPDYLVRESAAHTIARIRQSQARWAPPPFPAVTDRRSLVAEQYSRDRRRIREAGDAAEDLRTSTVALRRENAARALSQIGGPGAIPVLAYAAAYDPDSAVRQIANRGVEGIRRQVARWQPPPLPAFPVAADQPPVIVGPPERHHFHPPGPRYGSPQGELILNTFIHYLRRQPTAEEVRHRLGEFQRGRNFEDMLVLVLSSDEYFVQSGRDPARLIVRYYNDVLRRQPDQAGLQGWLQQWQRLRGNRETFARRFVEISRQERQLKSLPY